MYNNKHTQSVRFERKKSFVALTGAILSAVMATSAVAQEPAQADNSVLEEVTVTGTLIKGGEATGSKVVTVDAEAIGRIGAVTTNEILGSSPQVGNMFNGRTEGDPRGAAQDTINRPNLRNLPGWNAASGSVTLLMLDGGRLTPVGVEESALDPDIIPAAILDRVDIVPDGGSALYGADAVGGVINFVTKREFEGVQVDLNFVQGDTISEYDAQDYSITAGQSWDGGNAYVSISHADRSVVTNGDTDWARIGVWADKNTLNPIDTECDVAVGTEMRYFFYPAVPNVYGIWTNNPAAPGTGVYSVGDGKPCDKYLDETLQSGLERDSIFASFTQDLGNAAEFRVTSYYTDRTSSFANSSRGYTTRAAPAPSPVLGPFTPLPTDYVLYGGAVILRGVDNGTAFSFRPNSGYVQDNMEIGIETWGINPELTFKLTDNWDATIDAHLGRSVSSLRNPDVNRALAQSYVDSGDLNPYNVAAADPSIVSSILDYRREQDTVQTRKSIQFVTNGTLGSLPAGDVKAAFGFAWANDGAATRAGVGAYNFVNDQAYIEGDRTLTSYFGEVQMPLLDTLDLSVAVRADEYSDFGKTTNPAVGLTYKPNDILTIKAKWGESFNAPTVLDEFGVPAVYSYTDAYGQAAPGPDIDVFNEWDGEGTWVLHLAGNGGNLKPQTAENKALTVELTPVDGLMLSTTYYEIDFDNILGAVNPLDKSTKYASPEKYIWNPSQAVIDEFLARASNGSNYDVPASSVAYLLDRITSNLNSAIIKGFDFNINYTHEMGSGFMSYGLSGDKILTLDRMAGDSVTDVLAVDTVDLIMSGNIMYTTENLTARWTTKYTGGYDTDDALGFGQSSMDAWITHDVMLAYNFGEGQGGFSDGLSVRFNIDNVTDEEPDVWYKNASLLSYNSFTLGRVFKLGISKKF